MKLTEHLEHIIGLVEQPASQSEVKGALLAMQEEVQGYERAAAEKVKLLEENVKLRHQVEQLVSQLKLRRPSPSIPPQAPNVF